MHICVHVNYENNCWNLVLSVTGWSKEWNKFHFIYNNIQYTKVNAITDCKFGRHDTEHYNK